MTTEQRLLTDILYEAIKIQGDTNHIAQTSMRLIDYKLSELIDFTMRIPETDELLNRLDEMIWISNLYSLAITGLLGIILGVIIGAVIIRLIIK